MAREPYKKISGQFRSDEKDISVTEDDRFDRSAKGIIGDNKKTSTDDRRKGY